MGEDEDAIVDDEQVDDPTENEDADPLADGEAEENEAEKEAEEFEVVRQTDAGSQPDRQHGIRKRINKLNAKVAAAEDSTTQVNLELEKVKAINQVQALALEQQKDKLVPPDPVDFDDGVQDARYIQALQAFTQPAIEAAVNKHAATLQVSQPEPVDPNIERAQINHYERADDLKVKDFDDTENKAIAIIGNDVAKHIIQSSDNSHFVMYYLGKHPGEAENIKALIDSDPIKGVLAIGRLEAELSVKPKAKREPAPNPDDELSGSAPSNRKRGPKGATYS